MEENLQRGITRLKQFKEEILQEGTWDACPYNHGMANGVIIALAMLAGEEPKLLDTPERWIWEKELRPEVKRFACTIEDRLRNTGDRPKWRDESILTLGGELGLEAARFKEAVFARNSVWVMKQAVAIATCAMMIFESASRVQD